jgi:hypothetical protein
MDLLTRSAPPKNAARPNTPEWMYNEIMRFIEPDLLIENLPLLALWYADESDVARAARLRAYDEAFKTFDAAFANAKHDIAQEAAVIRRRAQARAMAQDKAEAERHLFRITSAIDDSPHAA